MEGNDRHLWGAEQPSDQMGAQPSVDVQQIVADVV
jgi:hypothetical protein